MIRLFALFCLLALPAGAQDFRGLLPGMPASALYDLGEPSLHLPASEPGALTEAIYPLPYGQTLRVLQDGERILFLEASGDAGDALPPSGGFQSFRTSLSEVVARAGSEGWYFESEGQASAGTASISYRLSYDLPDHPDLFLSLVFFDASNSPVERDGDAIKLPGDIPFLSAELVHRDLATTHPDFFGTTVIQRPGAAPFALPLAEAFPFTDLP